MVFIRKDKKLTRDGPRLEDIKGRQAFCHGQSVVKLAMDDLQAVGFMPQLVSRLLRPRINVTGRRREIVDR